MRQASFHYVYLLQSEKRSDKLYVGYTTDINARIKKHNQGHEKSTKLYIPWRCIHFEAYRNEKDARRREKYLKTSQGSRLMKRMLKEFFYEQK